MTVTRGKKYLLRLINTSVDTTFVFAIDHHNITVMSSDFVPIQPYTTDHVAIGIELIGNETLFEVGVDPYREGQGRPLPNDAFVRWAIAPKAMYLNFSDPTVLNLRNTKWNPDYAVIPRDYPEDSWIYMVIYGNRKSIPRSGRLTIPAAHPQSTQSFDVSLLNPKYDNPPRRDVVLLPADGFVAIAFKADNPGSWLLHCHIAWHASSGLAMQILERQEAAAQILTPQRLDVVREGCRKWKKWFSNEENLWEKNATIFQDDSGI
ncbi:MAG: hypothetical protein Q9185_002681 [Variospora sp. 1 TL-2023]